MAQILTSRSRTVLSVPDLSKAAAIKALQKNGYTFVRLLASPTANPKVAKNMKQGIYTAPLHLAPAKMSGFQVCPKATPGCTAGCLHYAGHAARLEHKTQSRISKTNAFFRDRALFMALLVKEIKSLEKAAEARGMIAGCRLNATSDIAWETVKFVHDGKHYENVMEMFPNVQFYDYTKRANRKNIPSNYHLTFSLAEDNDNEASVALSNGMNVAMVFDVKRSQELPGHVRINHHGMNNQVSFNATRYKTNDSISVIDGDEHDYRPADPKGVIVGLRAKGRAIGDSSGFVRVAA